MKTKIITLLPLFSILLACENIPEPLEFKTKEVEFSISSEANIHQLDLANKFQGVQNDGIFYLYIYNNPSDNENSVINIEAPFKSKTNEDFFNISLNYKVPKEYFNSKLEGIESLKELSDLSEIIQNKDFLKISGFTFYIERNNQIHHYISSFKRIPESIVFQNVEIIEENGSQFLSISASFHRNMYKAAIYGSIEDEFNIDFLIHNGRFNLLIPLI